MDSIKDTLEFIKNFCYRKSACADCPLHIETEKELKCPLEDNPYRWETDKIAAVLNRYK